MRIGAIHHVTLTVRDMARSIAFYRDVLGLRVALDMALGDRLQALLKLPPDVGTQARAVMMTGGEHVIGQVELIEFSPGAVPAAHARPGAPGSLQLCFEMQGEDPASVLERLRAEGVGFFSDGLVAFELPGIGVAQALIVEDPDGVMIELIRFPTPDERRAFRAAAKAAAAGQPT